ncbi:hypothetical protein CLOP_g17845 [Closterium sp. NIES-67]|nr:hypothetical protein CLOP_g17845 [Closterium sp. NIES-67]
MDHALAGPQRGKWLVSRDAEYNSQMENHTWDLVYLPNGKKAIQCKWLAKIKTDEKGEPSVYKSRLVAKGFQQKEKEDYKEGPSLSSFPSHPTFQLCFNAFSIMSLNL